MATDIDHPERDDKWNRTARTETETERLDRNWSNLLQELRVTQTGVQFLTGFLLILPFQPRFAQLSNQIQLVFLVTVACSIASTVLLIAPVGMHRLLFRRHRLRQLVAAAHRCALAGLTLLGAAFVGVAVIIFDVVVGPVAGYVAGACTVLALITFWAALPLLQRRTGGVEPTAQ